MAITKTFTNENEVDLSSKRDGELQELFDSIPYLKINPFFYSFKTDKSLLEDVASYPTYSKRRVLGDLNLTPRLNDVVGVLVKPVAVWRDFRQGEDNRQGTVIEYYFGIINKNTDPAKEPSTVFVLAIVQRNILIETHFSENELDLLENISGLQVHKGF